MIRTAAPALFQPEQPGGSGPDVNIGQALELYSAHTKGLARGWERQAQLERLLSRFRDRKVRSLRQAELVEALSEWSGPTMNRYRSATLHFLKFCRQREWTELRPELPRNRERSRDHVLTIEQLRTLFASAAALGPRWQGFCRLLILTGQRRGEVVAMRPTDVRDGWWTLSHTKNGQPHLVWLPAAALAELPASGEVTPWTGASGFSDIKERWDRESGISGWRLHDLRRSFTTHLVEAGASPAVVDKMLNHDASAPSGVSRVYNRAKLLDARREAAEEWMPMLFPSPGAARARGVAAAGAGRRRRAVAGAARPLEQHVSDRRNRNPERLAL